MKTSSVLALALALAMLLCLFTGCSGQEPAASPADAQQPAETAAPAEAPAAEPAAAQEPAAPEPAPEPEPAPAPAESPAAAPAEAPAPAPGPEPAQGPEPEAAEVEPADSWDIKTGVVSYPLPLFDTPLDLSIYWVQLGGQPPKTDLLFWDRLQEALQVNLEFKQISETTNSEQYNLMIASGDLTDLIWEDNCAAFGSESAYPGGYDTAIDDEIYLELTDLLPEFTPNYWAILEHCPAARKELTTDTGKLYSVSMVYSEPQGSRFGMLVRQDYMDDTGMEVPEDTDGWLEVMRAMKANGVVYPYGAQSAADLAGFIDAFGTTASSVFKVDRATDSLVYDGNSPELRSYVAFFRTLYAEGLVSPDYINVTMFDRTMQTDGTNAMFQGMSNGVASFRDNYGIDVFAPEWPYETGYEGKESKIVNYEQTVQQTISNKNTIVTTCCGAVEDALMVLDWFYSEEGIKDCNYGFVEGETYEIVDGVIQPDPILGMRSDAGYDNELIYALDEGPMVYILDRYYSISDPVSVEIKEIWSDFDMDAVLYTTLPKIMLTTEESAAVSSRRSDIDTFATTQIMKWETCQDELNDETWDAYCATLESMGLEEILATYNGAYERYKAR